MTARLISHLRRSSISPLVIARASTHLLGVHPSSALFVPCERTSHICSGSSVHSLCFSFGSSRTFSSFPHENGEDEIVLESSELLNLALGISDRGVFAGQDSILPIRVVISLIDGVHELTGLPWWLVIASSTVSMRLFLFPILVLQLRKLKRIGELLPKLSIPRPLPNTNYVSQFSLFLKEKRAIGCPSFLWFGASLFIQVPMFICWLTSVRRMCLDHHHGFDSGGTLWFQNLSAFSDGLSGLILPFCIAAFHFTAVQILFDKSSYNKMPGMFGTLARIYQYYLYLLTPVIFLGSCSVPQGSQIYWLTNISWTVLQQWSLKQPSVRELLGITIKDSQGDHQSLSPTVPGSDLISSKIFKDFPSQLSAKQLSNLAVRSMSTGDTETAIYLLQCAVEKDPNLVEAWLYLGKNLLQKGYPVESAKVLEHASKLIGEVPEKLLIRIVANSYTGLAYFQQGKREEGIGCLKKVVSLGEPDDHEAKMHYLDSVVMLAAALHVAGQESEASNYLNMATAYNPSYKDLFDRHLSSGPDLVTSLMNSRRADY